MKEEKETKYYAMAKCKRPGIYRDWSKCKKYIKGYSRPKYKAFTTLEDAKSFMKAFHVEKYIIDDFSKKKSKSKFYLHKCAICNKPLENNSIYCPACSENAKRLRTIMAKRYKAKYPIPKYAPAIIASKHPFVIDIFDYIFNNPSVMNEYYALGKEKRSKIRNSIKDNRKKIGRIEDRLIEPRYIRLYFRDNEDKSFISATGSEKDPIISFKCKRCGENVTAKYSVLKSSNGHYCTASMSSGEYAVNQYLIEKGVKFKTQYETLKCINPLTGFVLPYDFEISDKKIIIEVQGEQHTKYIPLFHQNIETYDYQVYKDKYKKEHAISKGYRLLEIFYEDIKNKKYKEIIDRLLN